MSEYDLTPQLSTYLDRHLVFPLLEFLDINKVYSDEDILKSKLDLLEKTNMVDFALDIYKKLNKTDEVPVAMKERREAVVAKMKELQTECAPLLAVIDNSGLIATLRKDKTFTPQYLEEFHNVTAATIDALYRYAKFQFECGNYSGASEHLFHFRALNNDPEKNFSALWGRFAAQILMQDWENALKDLNHLKELIDSKNFTSPLKQLQQRTWLIHWSLFVFFNHPNGRNGIVDLFYQDRYMNAIQTTCPHILRYLTTAVITNKRRRSSIKDLVKVLQQESYTYRDPITEFLEALHVNFDFDGAQVKLRECEKVLSNDFFLVPCKADFLDNARLFIFETFCRIHQCIDIGSIGDKLNMSQEDAEKWIVNLIRNARLDAKIDSKANHVIMGAQYTSVYQKVIEKTKGLSFRSYVLANSLAKSTVDEESQSNQETLL